MASLRTAATAKKYEDFLAAGGAKDACPLCEKAAVHEFTYWRILENDFPYDLFAAKHHMLVPRRHTTGAALTAGELAELADIKTDYVNERYEWLMEATPKNQSLPEHFHLHLIVPKALE